MLIKTIYLIRHGETEFNRRGIVQGSGIDSDLNELGFLQAKAFFDAYHQIAFDKIYTSKLRRTVQSVQEFINLGIPFEQYEGLNEISWGEKEGKVPNYLQDKNYHQMIADWSRGKTNLPAAMGGESPEQVRTRQKAAFEKIIARSDEKIILVAMHGRAIRILLTHLLELPLATMDSFSHSNLCLYQLIYDYHTRKFSLNIANDTTHLHENLTK